MFQRTTAITKILNLKKFVKGIQGGTSAGKTYGIIPILIDIAAKSPNDISIVAESIPHLKRGAMKDFKKIMVETGRWFDARWNASDFKYNFANGSTIEFFSADVDAKLRGARRDYLYMNECNNMTFHSYTELASRTKKGIYLDWNPTNEFWFHEHLQHDNDVDYLVINYLDNEACPESALNFINKAKEKSATSDYWANWHKVYGLGEIGSLQGSIFEFVQVDSIPKDAEFISYGLDWGFTNDPTALIECYRYNGELFVNELLYSTGLTNSDIINRFNLLKMDKHRSIIADSAEPKSIEDIRRGGYSIKPADKGKDSVVNSIMTLKEYKLNVTKNSTNLIKELRSYVWDRDREGKNLNYPIDFNNHCFIGETLITTSKGLVRIDNIKVGDMVLTSKGYNKVLKVFDNGVKLVNNYSMQLDSFDVSLWSTFNHKVKTLEGWSQISQLRSGQVVYLHKPSTEKIIGYTQKKDIFQGEQKECTYLFGNTLMAESQKAIISIIVTAILGIIELKTLILLRLTNIYRSMVKKDLGLIKNGSLTSTQKESSQLRNGINLKKEVNGTQSTLKNNGSIKRNISVHANGVVKNTKPHSLQDQSFAITTAKLVHLGIGESRLEKVYDIMVENEHEYFANGVLVHNCIDSLRYIALNKLKKNQTFDYSFRGM